jgi:hypothetical protein
MPERGSGEPPAPKVEGPSRAATDPRSTRYDDVLVATLTVAAAVAAGLAPAAPTGSGPIDAVLRAGVAALVTLAATRARTWTVVVLAGAALAFADGWLLIPAGVAALLSLAMAMREAPPRLAGVVVGAVAVEVLFHQRSYGVP